jgi:hypothetical protein
MKEKLHHGAFCDPYMQVNTSYTIRSLQKNGRSNHRNDNHYGSHDEPVSPDSPGPRRLIFLLLPIVCGSLCCPPGLFFLLGFFMVSHSLPLCHQGGCSSLMAVNSVLMPGGMEGSVWTADPRPSLRKRT